MKKHSHERPLAQLLPDQPGDQARFIRRVIKIGCIVNAVLMALKLAAGYLGHSDALVADGFHSLNDLAADLIMLIFVGISYRAADERYTYGYGKFETFSSFLISSFLVVIALMIGAEAIESIIDYARGETLQQPDIWTFVVVLFSMACKEGLFRFYSHAGRRADSKALLANAWHHRSDALASIATLVGVTFSHFFGPAFRVLDPIASLAIAVFILLPAIRLLRPAFGELMERSLPHEQVDKARNIIQETPGVERISRLRTRRNGHHLIFDIHINIASGTTIDRAADIAADIEKRLKAAFCPHIYVNVSMNPA